MDCAKKATLPQWQEVANEQEKNINSFAKAYGSSALILIITAVALDRLRRSKVGTLPLVATTSFVMANAPLNRLRGAKVMQKEREDVFKNIKKRPLDPSNKDFKEAAKSLPQLFRMADISKKNDEDLDLPSTFIHFQANQKIEPLAVFLSPLLAFLAILYTANAGIKIVKNSYHFAPNLSMPQIRWEGWRAAGSSGISLIAPTLRFSGSLMWGTRTVPGDHLLKAIELGILPAVIWGPLDQLTQLKKDLAAERIQFILERKIQLAASSGSPQPDLEKLLTAYPGFVKELTLNNINETCFTEIAPHLGSLTYLKIQNSENLTNEHLQKFLPYFKHLKTLILKDTPNVTGSFWSKVPGTVEILQMPSFQGADELGEGPIKETYHDVTIGKITEKGAEQLKKNLHAKFLHIQSLEKPDRTASWEKKDLQSGWEAPMLLLQL